MSCQRKAFDLLVTDIVPYQCFGLLDMLIAEQELAVEVAEIDGVEIYNVYLAEAGEDEVLEEFAANAASSYHQDA